MARCSRANNSVVANILIQKNMSSTYILLITKGDNCTENLIIVKKLR
jgi:hypothetical protein